MSDGGVLAFNTPASTTLTYAGNVIGAGSILQKGTGVVKLSGDNTAVNGAYIDSGTVQMGSATGFDNIPVYIAANATSISMVTA